MQSAKLCLSRAIFNIDIFQMSMTLIFSALSDAFPVEIVLDGLMPSRSLSNRPMLMYSYSGSLVALICTGLSVSTLGMTETLSSNLNHPFITNAYAILAEVLKRGGGGNS